ncbi:MAG: imidazole glycerol phosphate synthase subunit HisH [Pseudomonadota bacterium]
MVALTLVDYGSGNIRSVAHAFMRAGATLTITSKSDEVLSAERLVVPGQGAFGACVRAIQAHDGLWQALDEAVTHRAIPYFGICVGMQLAALSGLEHGRTGGFGWVDATVRHLGTRPDCARLTLPHMGWNRVRLDQAGLDQARLDQPGLDQIRHRDHHPVLSAIPDGSWFYFAHSYYLDHDGKSGDIDAAVSTDYGGHFCAAIAHGSMIGTQFHPEKSQANGARLIEAFLGWRP